MLFKLIHWTNVFKLIFTYIKYMILNYIFRIAHACTYAHVHTRAHTHTHIYIYISLVTHFITLNNIIPPNNILLD